jgi:hypothetical protein
MGICTSDSHRGARPLSRVRSSALGSHPHRLDQARVVVSRAVDTRRYRPRPQRAVWGRSQQLRGNAGVLAQPSAPAGLLEHQRHPIVQRAHLAVERQPSCPAIASLPRYRRRPEAPHLLALSRRAAWLCPPSATHRRARPAQYSAWPRRRLGTCRRWRRSRRGR